MSGDARSRVDEWYVPRFGPERLRLFVGLTFWPYTLMNAAYVVIGSALAPTPHWDRAAALTVVYLLAVGLSAHSLDAMGPNKPWGRVFSEKQLLTIALASLAASLSIGAYYSVAYAPLLLLIGAVELFFLFAYNLEIFGSSFHSKPWFALSWGFLPVQAGYCLQTGSLDPISLVGGIVGFTTAYVEISASRPYKRLKALGGADAHAQALRYETVLKAVVTSVLLLSLLLTAYRLA